MLLSPLWRLFEERLFPTPSKEGLFNPYNDQTRAHDCPNAVAIRQANLRNYLACYEARPPLLLLAEAPGPWGCRFSGVPLTSEAQLVDEHFPISGKQSSLRATPHTEYSANIYWRVLQPYFPLFFTWNSVPYHPYKPGNPLSIRNPTNREVLSCSSLLTNLVQVLEPRHALAIGRKAEHLLGRIGVACTYVRHPSQGGARLFEEGVKAVLQRAGLADGP